MDRRPTLLAVGGAHVDRRGIIAGPFVPGASNPGTMREDIGGGAFNALRMAAQRGVSGAMLSLRGGDAAGAAVADAIAHAGLADLSGVFLDRATPSYTALIEESGELVAGFADMGLYEAGFAKQVARRKARDAIAAADAVLCDANLPGAALGRLAGEAEAHAKPVFAIAVSPAKIVRLAGLLARLKCLFMNRREAAALTGNEARDAAAIVAALREKGLAAGVVTSGGGPVLAFDGDGAFEVAPPRPVRLVDVTGAGDALAGAAVAALMRGAAFPEAVREGVAAATHAVQCAQASPIVAEEAFRATLALVGKARRVA
jgi:sugar/nucleoside kinase (ribokinase family)